MLKDKVAIITGGTRGIGFGIARKFLENGAKVIIFGTKEETVLKAIKELKQKGHEIEGYYPNLLNEVEVKEVVTKIVNKYGKIDILVNNAGISQMGSIEDISFYDFTSILDINVKAMFLLSKMVIPYMKEQKEGVILNTSSMVSKYGQPSGIGYPTSKFAVNGFTLSLARELAPFHIRVNAVAPGITKTEMTEAIPKEKIEPLIQSIPLGRLAEVEDIANAFLFLASPMANYITGEVLHVDGLCKS